MTTNNPIAIVGMAGVFPGATTLDQFWQNILNKVDTTSEVPPDRWIIPPTAVLSSKPAPDMALSNRACLINNFDFDPSGLDLEPDFVKALDPLYHLVLHAGREAFGDCKTATVDLNRVGTILAAIALPTESASALARATLGHVFEAQVLGALASSPKPLTTTECLAAQVTSLPAALLAQGLGLGGGTYTLDAACASSLYAIKLACDELQSMRADMMIAGGVSRPDCLYTQIGFSQLQALSPTGRCAPFDNTANGLVVGEGVGLFVLKRLVDALNDDDTIYGVIRGIGLANDIGGRLLAPDSEGQVRAMQAAYAAAGWSPQDVDLIECHGAGTPVGDATELKSLSTLWSHEGWAPGQCGIGSIKSMIGHLLTAAGAAGLIKTLLALKAQTLPPSLKFNQANADSPLIDGPWRVLTEPEHWSPRTSGSPRRSAVSAFGFGGINAHLLVEEWPVDENNTARGFETQIKSSAETIIALPTKAAPIAIVGMGATFGKLKGLRAFQESIFNARSTIGPRPDSRLSENDATLAYYLKNKSLPGGYIDSIEVSAGKYHIPPNEIPDIIPQHLLMLQVATEAMADAGMPARERQPQTGVVVGIDFDFEATNFILRWDLYNKVQQWRQQYGLTDAETVQWLDALKKACGPPLTATRTLGALGGVIASRIAKEFLLGGPSFVVSNAEASGLKALDIGLRSLQQNETDIMVVGAVDFVGDIRRIIATHMVQPYSHSGIVQPFDEQANGTLPGEGAAAIVIKRLEQAIDDHDHIYAVIKGIGHAHNSDVQAGQPNQQAYTRALTHAFQDAGTTPETIGYIETHGSGIPAEDALEARSLSKAFGKSHPRTDHLTALGSLKPTIGHTGAAAGLASVVKTSLCLFHEIIPALQNYRSSPGGLSDQDDLSIPAHPHYWFRNRTQGPRRACVGVKTGEGNCSHLVLEGHDYDSYTNIPPTIEQNRKKPLGFSNFGLFSIHAESPPDLLAGLDALSQHLQHAEKAQLPLEAAACQWHRQNTFSPKSRLALAITLKDFNDCASALKGAQKAVSNDTTALHSDILPNVSYTTTPLVSHGEIAFVFPGSGNHYLGMGRQVGIQFPDIIRKFDFASNHLASQQRPRWFIPQRSTWLPGWEVEADIQIASDPMNMIFGQVVHGSMMACLIERFGIKPAAVIGYSLGESAGLFAMNVWSDRDAMLARMLSSDLFTTQLAGPCLAARKAWNIASEKPFEWAVAVVDRSADEVRHAIRKWPHVRLLIINTPKECVIGGDRKQLTAAIDALQSNAFFLDGVVTVHCDAALPVREAYETLHVFPVTPPEDVRFYSCAQAQAYALTSESAAASIAQQAIQGFDFPATIGQAYADGVRIFLEMGPQASCTRMIHTILGDKPHLAVSACRRAEHDDYTILKFLGELIAHHVPINMDVLYGPEAYPSAVDPRSSIPAQGIIVPVGGLTFPSEPPQPIRHSKKSSDSKSALPPSPNFDQSQDQLASKLPETDPILSTENQPAMAVKQAIDTLTAASEATATAHQEFLEFSDGLTRSMARAIELQSRLLQKYMQHAPQESETPQTQPSAESDQPPPAFTRDMCMEFAIGSIGKVLGPEFDVIDTYEARVRLPDEPLMLVDRIKSIEGRKRSLGSGRIVTEHDVLPDAWYLDGGRAPVCISVEAGQADLFLCSYLGIDHVVKGKRTYRLLDATVEFQQDLPCPGDVLRYEIEIDKFVKQGDTHLFFFNFKGFNGDTLLLQMTDGCAGFFTEAEVRNSGGIILTPEELAPQPKSRSQDWHDLVPGEIGQYNDQAVEALRQGDLARCFGAAFDDIAISKELCLPGGRMRLIDRILQLDPNGGRFGLGIIRAEADIHPDDWFLTCHFMDDMVMPGTLMYECCAHTLRVFVQRLGWVTSKPGVHYGPVPGIKSVLKCRGPVTPETRHVVYEVEIKEIGYRPEPYVIADAHMYADDHRIVMFKNMSLQMWGIERSDIESVWLNRPLPDDIEPPTVFDHDRLREFCRGKPSKAFGNRYKIFDDKRFIARLPAPPYAFIDRVTSIEPPAWVLKPDGWIEADFEVAPEAWYFRANRTPSMPYCIINEIALQACGWLAAYMGSALNSDKDLRFRNLGGTVVAGSDIRPVAATLKTRARLTKISEAADMIIEHYDFIVTLADKVVYEGNTHFGFFTEQALAQQVGISEPTPDIQSQSGIKPGDRIVNFPIETIRPLTPEDADLDSAPSMAMPATALCMFDQIETYDPEGGAHGLGFVRGIKKVDPDAWFFKAHFFQDPVCPGSLGLESILQLLKFAALQHWDHLIENMRFGLLTGVDHSWTYRGQILPTNNEITVEATVTEIGDAQDPFIKANGLLHVDGLCIYKMQDFGIRMVPLY